MAMLASLPPHESKRFTVADVQAMVEAGLFDGAERVELLKGELVVMSPQGPVHAVIMQDIANRLGVACGTGLHIRQQVPLECGLYSAPEPDVAVVRGKVRDYLEGHPTGGQCLLAVEVAVSSQAMDRAKATIYAAGGVAEYWLVDVPAHTLIRHRQPDGTGAYGLVEALSAQDSLRFGEHTLHVADLLP